MPYESVIWDLRDETSEEPASHFGVHPTREAAWKAIFEHLTRFPDQLSFVTRLEVQETPNER